MKRIIEIGMCALVFFLPWQTRWIIEAGKISGGVSEFLTYSLYASDVLLIVTLAFTLVYLRKNFCASLHLFLSATKKGKFFRKENIWSVIASLFLLIVLISIFFAEDKMLATFFAARIFLAVGFFMLSLKFVHKTKIIFCFVLGLIGPAILAIWQFLIQQTFALKWLGLAEHQAWAGGVSVVETYANGIVSGRWLRAYGSFDHPNILGGALAIGLLLTLWLFTKWRSENKKNAHMLFAYLSFIVLSAGIFVSFSRSSWLSLFSGIVAGGTVLFFQKRKAELKTWILGAGIVAVVFIGMFLNYQSLIIVRTSSNARLEKLSIDQRRAHLEQAKELIAGNPTTGVGIGNYILAVAKSNPGDPAWTYQPVHNVLVLVWAELGIFGVILVAVSFGLILWRYGKRNYLSLALLIALLPAMFLDHWFWSLHFGVLFFAIVISLAVGFSEKEKV